MKLIYVASPYRGDIEQNTEYAETCCHFVLEQGGIFYCPHLLLPHVLDENVPSEREMALEIGKEMLLKCDEVWAFGDRISEGMAGEITFAEKNDIPVVRVFELEQGYEQTQEQSQESAQEISLC